MHKTIKSKLGLQIILIISIFSLFISCNQTPQSILHKTGESAYMIPQVQGIENAAGHNEQLKIYFNRINEALRTAEVAEIGAELNFAISPKKNSYILSSWIEGPEGQKLLLEDLVLNTDSIDLPEVLYLDIISDKNFINRSLFLASKGYELRLFELTQPLTAEKTYALFSIYYEDITGREIDYSHVNRADIFDIFQLKALGIMPEILEGHYPHDTLYIQDYLHALSRLIPELLFDSYGLGSSGFNASDLKNSFSLYHSIASLPLKDNENMAKWENFGRDFSALLENGINNEEQQKALSREDLASFFVFIYEEYFHNEDGDYFYPDFIDGESENGSFAVGQNLMEGFPQYGMFYHDYVSRFYELPSLTGTFMNTCLNDNFMLWELKDKAYMDEKSAIKSLDLLDAYFASLSSSPQNSNMKTSKINDRDYNWHISQYDTGEYADVNCMPTMTAMAIKWVNQYSLVSVEELRERFLPDFPDGWWMAQIVDSLSSYGINFDYHKITAEAVVDAIDRGGIVLAMFSEAKPGEQGHCEIIYGYEKVGNSLRFIVQDPGFGNDIRPDGNPRGKGRWLDSGYVIWTVERMNNMVVSIKAVG